MLQPPLKTRSEPASIHRKSHLTQRAYHRRLATALVALIIAFVGVLNYLRAQEMSRYVEEGIFVIEGEGEVRVGDQTSPIRAGSFCVMSPAEGFHSLRNTGTQSLKFVMCFAGTGVQMERKA